MKCPNCSMPLEHIGYGYYQCTLTGLKYSHEVDSSVFHPLCLLLQKLD